MDKFDSSDGILNFVIKQEIEIKIEPLECNDESLCNENTFVHHASDHFKPETDFENFAALKHLVSLNREDQYDLEPVTKEVELKIKEVEVKKEDEVEVKKEKEVNGRIVDNIEVKTEYKDDSETEFLSSLQNSRFPIILLRKLNIKDKKKPMYAEKSMEYGALGSGYVKKENFSIPMKRKTASHVSKDKRVDKCTEDSYKTENHNENRLLKNSTPKLYKCSECPFETCYKSWIRRHKLKHLTKFYTCSHCNYKSVHKDHLNYHLATHLKQLLKCSECCYVTKRTDHFETHRLHHFRKNSQATDGSDKADGFVTQSRVKSFKCSKCNFETTLKTNLKRHIRLIHSDFKMLKCSDCNYETTDRQYLTAHSIVHSEKLFRCSECNYKTKRKQTLQLHVLTHTGVKRHACSKCDFRSNDVRNLRAHELSHSNTPKLFSCSHCDYSSNYRNNLCRHLRTHSDEKLIKCSECDYQTNYKSELKIHLLNHSGVRLFRCFECDYATNDKRILTSHLLRHSGGKFKCSECDYKCNAKRYLDNHEMMYHKEKIRDV